MANVGRKGLKLEVVSLCSKHDVPGFVPMKKYKKALRQVLVLGRAMVKIPRYVTDLVDFV